MRQKPGTRKEPAEKVVKDIRRRTRTHHSAEEKIRIVLEGARSQPTDRHPSPISMPAFDWKLSDRQVADVLTWLRRSWGNDAPPVDPETVGDLRETLAEAR